MKEVFVVNESTTIADERNASHMARILNWASRSLFAPAWGIDLRVSYAPKGSVPPAGAWLLQMLETSETPGGLGYHDEDGNEAPIIKVFVGTAAQAGDDPCAVCAHELWETAVDPHTNLSALTGDAKKLVAYEIADPVQGADFDAFDGTGKTAGHKVCDFVLPNYFDPNTAADAPTSYRGTVKGPFALAPQGYQSYIDMSNPGQGWQDGFGAERTVLPPWAARNPQRRLNHPSGKDTPSAPSRA